MFLNIMKTQIFEILTRCVFCEVSIKCLHIIGYLYVCFIKITHSWYSTYLGHTEIRTFIPLVISLPFKAWIFVFFSVFNYRDVWFIVDKRERSEDDFDSSTAPNACINFTFHADIFKLKQESGL